MIVMIVFVWMSRLDNGWMDGYICRWKQWWVIGRICYNMGRLDNGWMDGDGWMVIFVDGWMDGWVGGWMNGNMVHGWMDGRNW